MRSPFPGMDPFLEDPTGWGGVHSRLITSIGEVGAGLLAPQFSVRIEERVYIAPPDELARRFILPDVYVITGPDPSRPIGAILVSRRRASGRPRSGGSGGCR